MPAPPGDLGTKIRVALDRGKSRDEVVDELADGGLSRPTAERFVDRALSGPASTVSRTADPGDDPRLSPVDDPAGRASLVWGALWLSLGATATALTLLLAPPDGKYKVVYGAVLTGLLLFARGLKRWWDASVPFPWLRVVLALVLPPLALASIVVLGRWGVKAREEARGAAREELARAERLEQEAEDAVAARDAAHAARRERQEARHEKEERRIEEALDALRSGATLGARCKAAQELGRSGVQEAIPDLEDLLGNPAFDRVQHCAAEALVELGETGPALAFYAARSSDPEEVRRRTAYAGFGEIGPTAAAVALPHLEEALRSSSWSERMSAVDALAEMGAAGDPLLRSAQYDPDERVRRHVAHLLGTEAPLRPEERWPD